MSGLNFTIDGFRITYGMIAVWMWALTTMFSFEYFRHEPEHLKRYGFFTLVTFIATEGVMFSADLMTTFIFFEMLSLTSFVWVIHEETAEAIRAAKTYFFIAIIGGLVLFMGLALMSNELGTLEYAKLHDAIIASKNPGTIMAAGICILLGFGAKAGMFPLHIWLPKSHPVAPSPASALLSGILTKVGIFGVLMTAIPGFLGNGELSLPFGLIVLLAGTITMALGAVLALFSVNLKRTLACSSMSQIGFILVGVGTMILISSLGATELPHEVEHLVEEAMELAHNGIVLHMVNHSLIKLVLFMAAGVFVMNIHKLNLNDIRGYGRKKPLLLIPFVIGAVGIGGIPFFNGYISKTLLHEGLVIAREAWELRMELIGASFNGFMPELLFVIEWVFLISGGLTVAYMLKLFICIFVEKNPEKQDEYDRNPNAMNRVSAVALMLSAVILPLLGQPAIVGKLAALMTGEEVFHHFHAFSLVNLKGAFISIGIGIFVYFVIVRNVFMKREGEASSVKSYVNLWPEGLDLEDRLYRPVLLKVLPGIGGAIASFFANNTVSAPLAKGILEAGKSIAGFFAENTVTAPISKALLELGKKVASIFSVSLDGVLILLRKTIFKEKARVEAKSEHGHAYSLYKEAGYALEPILENFSFAMMMTGIGIAAVFIAILIAVLR